MKRIFELKKPIMINGKEYEKLNYDFDEVTIEGLMDAMDEFPMPASVVNYPVNPKYDAAIAMAAVIAVNPGFDYDDLRRIKGVDAFNLQALGLNFILYPEEYATHQKTSESAAENTANASTQA